MTSVPKNIKLKIGCDGVTDVKFHPELDKLLIGTNGGRVRIFDCSYEDPIELFRKRWHQNLSKLAISKSGSSIMSSSSQGGIKQHDFETRSTTWKCLNAHTESISAIVWQTENLFISGDEGGVVKIWDNRKESELCSIDICSTDENVKDDYLGAINDLSLDENGRHLFVAVDDGSLVTVNTRKRKVEMCSETLSYSVKSIQPFKNQTKLAVATDDGVISMFNWNEFGNLSDRFPITNVNDPIERMIKINENVMAMTTSNGLIKAASLQPNLILSDIGKHSFTVDGDGNCGDCMAIDINGDKSILVSGCPESDIICFYSPDIVLREFSLEQSDRAQNKRKKDRSVIKDRIKRKKFENDGFLDGIIIEEEEVLETGEEDSSEDDSD